MVVHARLSHRRARPQATAVPSRRRGLTRFGSLLPRFLAGAGRRLTDEVVAYLLPLPQWRKKEPFCNNRSVVSGHNVGLKRRQAKAFVAKGDSQIFLALKNQSGDGPKRQRFRRPLRGNFSGGNSSNFLSSGTPPPRRLAAAGWVLTLPKGRPGTPPEVR